MAGTVKASVIQNDVSNVAPVIRDGAGTEIGRLCRALANYNSSTQTINSSFNISSVTRNANGDCSYTFTNNFSDTGYVFSFAGDMNNAVYPRTYGMQSAYNTPVSIAAIRLVTSYTATFASSQTNENSPYNLLAVFR